MGLLSLPRELRDLIYREIIIKDKNTITMLPDLNYSRKEISACPPSICAVNRQIRQETLPAFYGANVFTAQLDNQSDLMVARYWLKAIGEGNVRRLRRLSFCGWTRIPFDHRTYRVTCRVWIKVVFDLKCGRLELDAESTNPLNLKSSAMQATIAEARAAFMDMFKARLGEPFDGESVGRLMQEFNSVCTGY